MWLELGLGLGLVWWLSARGNAASGCSGVSLSWFGWVPGPVSWESSLVVSLYWPEWAPGLIVPWQVTLRVSLCCVGVLRFGLCFPTPPPWPVVLGLVTGLPSALVFCDFGPLQICSIPGLDRLLWT